MPILNNSNYTILTSGINWDEEGIAQATLVASIGKSEALAKALSIKVHPDYDWMLRSGGTVTAKEADIAEISLQFSGIDPSLDGQVTSAFRASTSTEPIDTHPTFGSGKKAKQRAGHAQRPDDGWAASYKPEFNQDGTFKKFVNPDGGNKVGVESYLEPAVTFEQSKIFAKVSKKKLNEHCENIGKIDDEFFKGNGIPKPPTPGDRNWLLISAGYEDIGKGGKVTKMWRMSGRRGWDVALYN